MGCEVQGDTVSIIAAILAGFLMSDLPPIHLLPLAEREREYSPSSAIGGNYQPHIARYVQDSQLAHERFHCQRNLRYGEAPRALLDYFPAPPSARPAGLLVFIHGGYWQELSKDESAFLAPAWHTAGFAHAVVGYTLAPQARVGQIVDECRAALRFLIREAAALGHDTSRIVVAGSSAGGFLAAACAADPSLKLRGIAPISGIFDLRPLVGTLINEALGMDEHEAEQLSRIPYAASLLPAVISWGEIETQAFKDQSTTFAARWLAHPQSCIQLQLAGRNHFDVVHELAKPQSPLFAAVRGLFG
jgi:arylformamidase